MANFLNVAGAMALIMVLAGAADMTPTPVFTKEELALCGGKIRIPELVWTPSRILLVAQCRCWGWPVSKTGGCDHPAAATDNANAGAVPVPPRLTANMNNNYNTNHDHDNNSSND